MKHIFEENRCIFCGVNNLDSLDTLTDTCEIQDTYAFPYTTSTGEHNITTRLVLSGEHDHNGTFSVLEEGETRADILLFGLDEDYRPVRVVSYESFYPVSAYVSEDLRLVVSHPEGTTVEETA